MQERKTRDRGKYRGGKGKTGKLGTGPEMRDKITWVENAGLEKTRPNFARVEKAEPPSMEREMDKSKCIMYR